MNELIKAISNWEKGFRIQIENWYSLNTDEEKAMAPHSSTLAWKIPWMEGPDRLQSMGLRKVGPDWATSLSLFTFMHWGRKWQPTPVFLPGKSQGRGSLVGCRLWGRTESDTTEATQQQQHGPNIPDSYAILLFIASDFTSITSYIHNWVLFLLWLCFFILLELFLHWSPIAYWAPTDLGSSSFSILLFCLFILFMGFSRQEY